MKILERLIQQIRPDKWAELEALDKRYDVVESRLGFPPKRRYRCMTGGHGTNTLVIEREWASLAAMEETYGKSYADAENQALNAESASIVEDNQSELYWVLPYQ